MSNKGGVRTHKTWENLKIHENKLIFNDFKWHGQILPSKNPGITESYQCYWSKTSIFHSKAPNPKPAILIGWRIRLIFIRNTRFWSKNHFWHIWCSQRVEICKIWYVWYKMVYLKIVNPFGLRWVISARPSLFKKLHLI